MSSPTPRQPLESSVAEGFAPLTPTGGQRGGPDVMQPLGYGIFKMGIQKAWRGHYGQSDKRFEAVGREWYYHPR